MAKSVLVFKDNMIEGKRLTAEQNESGRLQAVERDRAAATKAEAERQRADAQAKQARIAEERSEMRAMLINDFDATVSQVLAVFGSAAHELQSSASTMSSAAEQTTQQSAAVAAATEEATMNV
jgi:hypothetical protein